MGIQLTEEVHGNTVKDRLPKSSDCSCDGQGSTEVSRKDPSHKGESSYFWGP